jgi:eukaryotic-like serine/threonine-protein kinase
MITPQDVDPLFLELQSRLLGRYSLERELGRGGTGVVYLAREVSLDRPVALKVLLPDQGVEARDRFLHEARTAARLSHPHIVPILTVEECGPFVFFTMPYIGGGTVGERVRSRGPFLPLDAVRLLRDVAWALAYSHGHDVIHRDIKPDNILLERETHRTLVADFGIAAAAGTGRPGSAIMGTPAFMSPEQIRGEAVDAPGDIYSLAAVSYYMLSGQTPFEAPTADGQLLAHLNQLPRPLRALVPQVPPALAQLVMRGLEKDPTRRPPSADAFAEALSHWLGEHRPVPAGITRFLTQLRESRPVALLYSTAVGLLLFIPLVLSVSEPSRLPYILRLAFLFALPPLVVILARVRALVALGHDRADLVEVLQAAADREEQEARHVQLTGTPWKRIALRWSAIIALAGGLLWIPGARGYQGPLFIVNLVSVACVVVLSDQVQAGSRERRRAMLWGGVVGRWLFRVGGFKVRRRIAPDAASEHRTEVALGLSARALFDRLPSATRRELSELPGIVQGLEAEAARTRQRRTQLRQFHGSADDPQFTSRLDSAEQSLAQRHAEMVTALEGIRLSLLRLHVGTATVEGLTTDLGRAADLASRLGHIADAQEDVDRLSA